MMQAEAASARARQSFELQIEVEGRFEAERSQASRLIEQFKVSSSAQKKLVKQLETASEAKDVIIFGLERQVQQLKLFVDSLQDEAQHEEAGRLASAELGKACQKLSRAERNDKKLGTED